MSTPPCTLRIRNKQSHGVETARPIGVYIFTKEKGKARKICFELKKRKNYPTCDLLTSETINCSSFSWVILESSIVPERDPVGHRLSVWIPFARPNKRGNRSEPYSDQVKID